MVVVHRVVGKVSQDEHDARESMVSEVCRLHFVCVFGIEGEVIFWEEIEHCWWEVECVRSGVFKPFCDCVADVFPGFLVLGWDATGWCELLCIVETVARVGMNSP